MVGPALTFYFSILYSIPFGILKIFEKLENGFITLFFFAHKIHTHKAKQNTGLLFNILRSLLGQAGTTSFAHDTQNVLDQNLFVSKMTGILE